MLGIDVRTVPGVDHPELITLITRLADALAASTGCTRAVTVMDDRPPVDTPVDSPVVQAMLAGHQRRPGPRP